MYNFKPLYGINRKFIPKINICGAILELQFDIGMHEKLYIGNQFGKFQMDA